jgi:hypothetical protein
MIMRDFTQVMDKINSLLDMKYEGLYIESQFINGPPERFAEIDKAFENLVDRFYRENDHLVTGRQYETARGNLDYFMILVEQTLAHYKEVQ